MNIEENIIEEVKVLRHGGTDELVEKKSRFIATVCPVESEQEAVAFIEETKKKYWDARHNCSAFVIGKRGELTRCSDDGEPGGTAGRPMLEVLLGQEVRNVAVVVTRYFGGTLLGTGGLVRAYTQAAKLGLEASEIVTMRYGVKMKITTDYNGGGKIQYLLGQCGISGYETNYTDNVEFIVMVPLRQQKMLEKKVTEATAAKAKIEILEKLYFT
ncbi:MAG: YigZ family protein [Lachnospiraceae bacterium]|nr:YigZ family protein [Lachnospiraceae bacterium]